MPTISGAECGCQAEVGSACAMAAAALGELFELSIEKIEYAAEICIGLIKKPQKPGLQKSHCKIF